MVSLPSLQLPTYKWRSTGLGRSWCLVSITGLAALDGQYHSLSGTYFSASSRVTCLLPATQAGSHAGPKVYIWNVFGSHIGNNSLSHIHSYTPFPSSPCQLRSADRRRARYYNLEVFRWRLEPSPWWPMRPKARGLTHRGGLYRLSWQE